MPYLRATPVATAENAGFTDITVTLDQPAAAEVRVSYDTLDGSATQAGSAADYLRSSGTLVFAPGEISKTVRIGLVNDATAEPREAFWFTLGDAVNATVQQRQVPVTVYDDDGAGEATTVVRLDYQPVVDESDGVARLVLWLDKPASSDTPLSFALRSAGGTASAADFGISPGAIIIPAGQLVLTYALPLINDTLAEATEIIATALARTSGTTKIVDPGPFLAIAANDASPVASPYIRALPTASDESQPLAGFTVLLSAPSTKEVRVDFDTLSGTTDNDFQRHSGTLVFAPGETSKTVPVMLLPDTVAEPDGVFWLQLSSPVNGIVEQALTPALLSDNDRAGGSQPSVIAISDAVVDEADGMAVFYVQLDRPATVANSAYLLLETRDGSATAGSDYVAFSNKLVWLPPGATLIPVTVPLLDDGLAEPEERFKLAIVDGFQVTVLDSSATAIIGPSDGAGAATPVISVQPIVVSEADGLARFVVKLDTPSLREVRVSYSLTDGTATSTGAQPDYQSHAGTLVFAPGDTVKTIAVALVNDSTAEGNESFKLELSALVNATLAQTSVQATVLDDDSGLLLSLGLGDDRYTVTSGSTRIAEGPGGGIDTVSASVDYTLPDNVENLVLSGSATRGTGNSGDNVLRGTAGANTLDGGAGIDTVVFTATRANSFISSGDAAGGSGINVTVTSATDGRDTLQNIERLQFSDTVVAYDTSPGGHTYAAYAMWNAAFNRAPTAAELGRWTATLDQLGGNTRDLAQVMINTYAPGVDDASLVSYLWGTIVGGSNPANELKGFTGLLANGTYTQASLVDFVATISLNTSEFVSIVGQPLTMDASFFTIPG